MAVSLGGGSILLVGESDEKITGGWRSACPDDDPPFRTQGLVQLRVINLDEDVDTQETSCYVHEGPQCYISDRATNTLKNKLKYIPFADFSMTLKKSIL